MSVVSNVLPSFSHEDLDGSIVTSDSLIGKKMVITFFRFATCPFCNIRLHQLAQMANEWGDSIQVVAFFESPLETLKKYQDDHHFSFPLLADPTR